MKISVLIPVYKVEDYIRKCAISLFSQSFKDVEFIFVNDATPDRSIDILKETMSMFPERDVKIISHPRNMGSHATRNTALKNAEGDYVFYCDSDDYAEPDLLSKLYEAASAGDCDIAYCDFFLTFGMNERYMHNPDFTTGYELLKDGFLTGVTKYNLWNKLIRRRLFLDNGIDFAEHAMGEDMAVIMLAACADRVVHVPEALYHYVKLNTGSYSFNISERQLEDIRFNVDRTVSFIEAKYGNELEKELAFFKLNAKLPFLVSGNPEDLKLWKEWYPEADRYVMDNKALPLRTRLLQWMASKKMYLGVRLYYILVYRFVYGIIYR